MKEVCVGLFFDTDSTSVEALLTEILVSWRRHEVLLKKKDHLTVWTDSCSGLNKNFLMICSLPVVQKGFFKTIDHKFPEVGYSYLDTDQDFGQIEKRLRKHKTICKFTPEDYSKVIVFSSRKKWFSIWNIILEVLKIFQKNEDFQQKKISFQWKSTL